MSEGSSLQSNSSPFRRSDLFLQLLICLLEFFYNFILTKSWHILSKISLIADFLFKLVACNFCQIKKYLHPKK